MIWASSGLAGNSLGALFGRIGGLLGGPEAILGLSWAVLKAFCAILATLVASQVRVGSHLGHLGRLGVRHGGVMAAQGASGEGAMHAGGCVDRGGL